MSVLPIPKTCIARMQRLIRNFLWDYGDSSRRHWKNWNSVCRPRLEGGLGLRTLEDIRKVCLGKLAWDLLNKKSFWAIHAWNRFSLDKKGSSLWESLKPWINKLIRDSLWDIGEGNIELGHFCLWLRIKVPAELIKRTLREVVEDRSLLSCLLGSIPAVMHGLFGHMIFTAGPDVILWRRTEQGALTSKTLYETIRSQGIKRMIFRHIWCSWIPPKISSFIWKLYHVITPTDDNVRKCGILLASKCWCCTDPSEETANHLFFKSEVAKDMWTFAAKIFNKRPPRSLFQLGKEWFEQAGRKNFMENFGMGMASCIIWEIWRYRNHHKMEGSKRQIMRAVKDWAFLLAPMVKGDRIFSLGDRVAMQVLEIPIPIYEAVRGIWISWSPFHRGNTLSLGMNIKDNTTYVGGIVRDKHGAFIVACRFVIEEDCVFLAILRSTELLHDKGYSISCVQGSNKLFECLEDPDSPPPWTRRDRWKTCINKDLSFKRVEGSLNNPANILSYNGPLNVFKLSEAPIAVRRAIRGDKFPIMLGSRDPM